MKKKVVRVTQSANADLLDAMIWITNNDGVPRAEKIAAALQRATESLDVQSERGSKVAELEVLGVTGYRQLRKHGFRIVYRIDRTTVVVLAVIHEKRDLATILMSRAK